MRLELDHGTVIFRPEPGDPLPDGLPGVAWDARVGCFRAPAWRCAAIESVLSATPLGLRAMREREVGEDERGAGADGLGLAHEVPGYVAAKLERLRQAALGNLILCLDADRNCGEGELPPEAAVIRYRRRIDVAAIVRLVAPPASCRS